MDTEFPYIVNDSINHTWIMKPQFKKTMDTEAYLIFLVGEHTNVLGGWHALTSQEENMETLLLGPFQTLPCGSLPLAFPNLYPS